MQARENSPADDGVTDIELFYLQYRGHRADIRHSEPVPGVNGETEPGSLMRRFTQGGKSPAVSWRGVRI